MIPHPFSSRIYGPAGLAIEAAKSPLSSLALVRAPLSGLFVASSPLGAGRFPCHMFRSFASFSA